VKAVIRVTRLNGVEEYWVNDDMIEFIEETPDTIISMISGKKLPVAEKAEKVIRLINERRAELMNKSWLNQ
jgi:flagellar protein FlbD